MRRLLMTGAGATLVVLIMLIGFIAALYPVRVFTRTNLVTE